LRGVIGSGVIVGPDCRIGADASLSHALLGARVYVYPGARIGQEGFGFASTKNGFLSVPQLGRVILEDDVEVGANTTIDRGSSRDTVIGAGSRLDNLVQIGQRKVSFDPNRTCRDASKFATLDLTGHLLSDQLQARLR